MNKVTPKIIFATTNELNFDQRMIRICSSLHQAGYDITLIGFQKKNSPKLIERPFRQKRINVYFNQGSLLYITYWIKLFFYLLFYKKQDVYCAVDLDTMLPFYWASKIKKGKLVYDAHEIFTELKEVKTAHPFKQDIWKWIGKTYIPKCDAGYTIGSYYADFFQQQYGVKMEIVRNATILRSINISQNKEKHVFYQGAVNKARCFEQLIPAMKQVDAHLIICGEGNFYQEAQTLVKQHNLQHKVIFKGFIPPEELRQYTEAAYIGITLFEGASTLSNYYSMANRFFDYMHSGVPQICNAYPEYQQVNKEFEIAVLLREVTENSIANAINSILQDDDYYQHLAGNSLLAREKYCWQNEEKKLLNVYRQLLC